MRSLLLFFVLCVMVPSTFGQRPAQAVYEAERAFERAVAEKGIRAGYVEFMSPVGVIFLPDMVNARESWKSKPESPAALNWSPIVIDVSANGAIGYCVGSSRRRENGKDDPNVVYGHYLSIWMNQGDGKYQVELDAGITHEKPISEPGDWRSPVESNRDLNAEIPSAADSSAEFFQLAYDEGAAKAYRSFLADDAILLRQGKLPAFDKKAATVLLRDAVRIEFSKRKVFTEAGNLGYVHGPYVVSDKKGTELERGNFVQVWKFRNKKWFIVADILIPLPARAS
ncbi:MAG TPA: hypothetical protein PKD26_05635 [Pyrinomonadaceae bacterium]|nr:hypothetical protein [Pyrinomonadaceae bacterium]